MPYSNLKAEMGRKDVTIATIAKTLKIHRNSVAYKLNRDGSFSIEEAEIIHDTFFPETQMKELFKKE